MVSPSRSPRVACKPRPTLSSGAFMDTGLFVNSVSNILVIFFTKCSLPRMWLRPSHQVGPFATSHASMACNVAVTSGPKMTSKLLLCKGVGPVAGARSCFRKARPSCRPWANACGVNRALCRNTLMRWRLKATHKAGCAEPVATTATWELSLFAN